MTDKSNNFEKQIERIYSLLAESDSKVTWDDRIPDPDNPSQPRQIDVTIRSGPFLTQVECRIHADAQDVQWIEELIGRRMSLKADTVIGVSASGFTRGAILKAKAHGIVLRDMKSLTEEEILAWGKTTKVSVELHHFDNVDMTYVFTDSDIGKITVEDVEATILRGQAPIASLFDQLVNATRERDPTLAATEVHARAHPKDLKINGSHVLAIDISMEYWCERKMLDTPTVVAYDAPSAGALERNAYVEIVNQDKLEITQSSDIVSVAMDMSSIEVPRGAKLGRIRFHFTRMVEMREPTLLGLPELGFWLGPHNVRIAFE